MAEIQTQPRMSVRVRSLDGLRGFAALAVVSSHLIVSYGLLPYPAGGVIGVLVFFVLSGYLVASICWTLPVHATAYSSFLRRRLQRLLPALAGLIVIGLPAMVALGGQRLGQAVRDAAFAASQLTAFARVGGVQVHPVWQPTWSLTVEWTFYLLAPVALLSLRGRGVSGRVVVRCAVGAAAVLFLCGVLLSPLAGVLLPVANLGVMLTGAALAVSHRTDSSMAIRGPSPGIAALGVVLLVALCLLPIYVLDIEYRLLMMPAVTFSTLIIIHQCHTTGPAARMLAMRPLQIVGVRAYSLYLWHLVVMWIVWVQFQSQPLWLRLVAVVVAVPAVVELSFRLLERPWMRGIARTRL